MTIYQDRIRRVRTFMRERLAAQAFILPRVDIYQSEYVVEADERLAWLTGFTGTAGFALILEDKAALFVDGRYTLQANQEVDSDIFDVFQYPDTNPKTFLQKFLHQGDKFTYDQWLMAKVDYDRWYKIATELSIQLCPASENPVDVLWDDRPSRPLNSVLLYPEQLSGQSTQDKLSTIQAILKQENIDAFICNIPESICWLFNIRGSDFPYTPLIDAFAIIQQKGKSELYIDARKIPSHVKKELSAFVTFREYVTFSEGIRELTKKHVLLDSHRGPMAITHLIPEDTCLRWGNDPCVLLKAIKNPIEVSGMTQAHVKDGVAVTKFLAWLSQALLNEEIIDELSVVNQLEVFRKEQEGYQGPSFATIAGFGANGAIIHYRPSSQTNKLIEKDGLLLIDSGGQYLDGTTDITRTIAIGIPNEEQKDRYTRVLKGHIALANTLFPTGTTGSQLDVFARYSLWQAGLDYPHGTGHGVGCYSSVHEGPQRISKASSSVGLCSGMVISNEPGYYNPHNYGIRIESLILVRNIPEEEEYECRMLNFSTLTMVPIDTSLILPEMLTTAERQWLNDYHFQVRETLLPHLDTETAAWLIEATEEI